MDNGKNSTAALWGIDLGGTKIECVVLESAQNPQVIERRRIPANGDSGYHSVLANIVGLVESISQDLNLTPDALGIGTPGTLDPVTGLLRGSNSQHLQQQPIKADLQTRLGIPVAVENDANCFALAETRIGAVSKLEEPVSSVFGVILGTGVGGGLIINNSLVSGKNLIAGEWGHNYLDASGGACYCGKTGCVETIISGPALERFYKQVSGESCSLPEIIIRKNRGDAHAIATVDRLNHFFGIGISCIINMIDPDVIVIGGGVGNIDSLYAAGTEEAGKYIFSPQMRTKIIKPLLGDSAGVFGAAFLTA